MDPRERDRIVDAVRQFFVLRREGVLAAYLFGSVARGGAAAGSDVDVAVLLESEPPRTLEGLRPDLRDGLQECLGRAVDLVVLNHAPADLVHRVLRDGILMLDENPVVRRTFEVQRRNEFFDLEPVRRQYRRRAATGAAAP
jgi:predicted nucleotidyltransferase